MTDLCLIPLLAGVLFLLNGCIHNQTNFSVATGGRNQPAATTVFADADIFAKQRGFQVDDIQVVKGLKRVSYHRNDNYLFVEHRTLSRMVDFHIASRADAYHQRVANRFRYNFMRQYSTKYGEENVAGK